MDVPFGSGSGHDLLLDIYPPDASDNLRTAALMFHGGGWRRGDRKNIAPRAKALQALGFTAIPTQYRLIDEAPWPSAVHDVKAAIRWVRANAADLGIDPDKIVLQGHSAGAHLSLVAAGTTGMPEWEGDGGNAGVDSSVAAVAAFYPPTVFRVGDSKVRGAVPPINLLGESPDPEVVRAASPLTYVSPQSPPTFFLHGGADHVVPTASSVVMHEALRAAGVETDLHVFAGQNHEFDSVDVFRDAVAAEVGLFFRRMVTEKETIANRILEQSMFARARAQQAVGGTS
ncbi:MAG: alpha/beta hydrolase fold domain-containing protein [Dehalococcoidia bacterium]